MVVFKHKDYGTTPSTSFLFLWHCPIISPLSDPSISVLISMKEFSEPLQIHPYSISFINGIQITTMWYYLRPGRLAQVIKNKIKMGIRGGEVFSFIAGKNITWSHFFLIQPFWSKQYVYFSKAKDYAPLWPHKSTSGHLPEESKSNIWKRYLLSYLDCCLFTIVRICKEHNIQEQMTGERLYLYDCGI